MEKTDDIEAALRRIQKLFPDSDEGAKKMFAMLLKKTLEYRDRLVSENQPALTVGETQEALTVFMFVLKTQSFPDLIDARIKTLVVLWLEGLKENMPLIH